MFCFTQHAPSVRRRPTVRPRPIGRGSCARHTVVVADAENSQKYPTWMLRVNRAITSRAFTFLAAAIFVMDAVPRLLDGRVARGIGNLAVATILVMTRERTRRAALGESGPPERRAQWAAAHPVRGALVAGAAWGAAMSFLAIITTEGPILPMVGLGLSTGLLLFAPGVLLLSRRYPPP